MKIKLEEFRLYLLSIKRSQNYFFALRPFINWLEKKQITFEQITKTILTDYIALKFRSSNSINLFCNAGKAFYKYLEIKECPFNNIEAAKVPKSKPRYLTIEEKDFIISKLITFHNKGRNGYFWQALIGMLWECGLRKMELVNILRKDVNITENYLTVKDPKNDENREVWYSPEYAETLKAYINSEKEITNCFNIGRGFMNYLAKTIKSIYPERNDINIHLFRHSWCHYLAEKGVPLTSIQSQGGWKNIKTMMKYCGADFNQNKRVMGDFYKKGNNHG